MAWLQKKNLKKLNDRKDQYRIVDDGIHHRKHNPILQGRTGREGIVLLHEEKRYVMKGDNLDSGTTKDSYT
jgi:hypothetical protein